MPTPVHPLFRRHTIGFVTEITGFSRDYVKKVSCGQRPASPEFRRRVREGIEKSDGKKLFSKKHSS